MCDKATPLAPSYLDLEARCDELETEIVGYQLRVRRLTEALREIAEHRTSHPSGVTDPSCACGTDDNRCGYCLARAALEGKP